MTTTKKIIEIFQEKPNFFHIDFLINNICQNHCWYCEPNLYNGSNHHFSDEELFSFIDKLNDQLKNKKVHIAFSGGEPTLYPKFIELVQQMKTLGWTVGLTSNGQRTARYFSELAPHCAYIAMSYHSEFAKDDWMNTVLAAAEHTQVLVRVMMDPYNWDHCYNKFNEFAASPNLAVEAVRLYRHEGMSLGSTGKDVGYTAEQDTWLNAVSRIERKNWIQTEVNTTNAYAKFNDNEIKKINTIDLVNSKQNSFVGFECDIGKTSLFINYNGMVKKGNCMQDGWLGHFNDIDLNAILHSKTKCHQLYCYCGVDVNVPKRKIP
jgi:organic radical activating enzyme